MAGISLSSRVEVLPCPSCKQTINTSMKACPFCSAPIDHAAATASAEEFAKVNQACSDASYLKIMAWSLLSAFLIMFLPIVGLAGLVGLWFLRFAIPVMLVRWWIKFGKIKSDDAEFVRAKRTTIYVGIVALLALASALPIHT